MSGGFDGSGNYNRPHSWVDDAANAVDITASRFDEEDDAVAAALSNCVTRDGQGKMAADFIADADSTRSIGSSVVQWLAGFIKTLTSETVDATTINGALQIPITNAETIGGVTPTDYSYEPGWLQRYGGDSTGIADSSGALISALAQLKAGGAPVRAPSGTWRIDASAAWLNANSGVFVAGPTIIGDGPELTVFDNRVANGYMLDIDSDSGDSHATFKGLLGGELSGFTIKTTTSPANSGGIKLRTSYQSKLKQIRINGLTGNGMEIPCVVGDDDGSNMVSLEQVRIESCAKWGIKADSDSGHNEISFLSMKQCFIQACGTASGSATPPSGGMIYKGQIFTADECAFVINENVGLFIPGEAGLGQGCGAWQDQSRFDWQRQSGRVTGFGAGYRGSLMEQPRLYERRVAA